MSCESPLNPDQRKTLSENSPKSPLEFGDG